MTRSVPNSFIGTSSAAKTSVAVPVTTTARPRSTTSLSDYLHASHLSYLASVHFTEQQQEQQQQQQQGLCEQDPQFQDSRYSTDEDDEEYERSRACFGQDLYSHSEDRDSPDSSIDHHQLLGAPSDMGKYQQASPSRASTSPNTPSTPTNSPPALIVTTDKSKRRNQPVPVSSPDKHVLHYRTNFGKDRGYMPPATRDNPLRVPPPVETAYTNAGAANYQYKRPLVYQMAAQHQSSNVQHSQYQQQHYTHNTSNTTNNHVDDDEDEPFDVRIDTMKSKSREEEQHRQQPQTELSHHYHPSRLSRLTQQQLKGRQFHPILSAQPTRNHSSKMKHGSSPPSQSSGSILSHPNVRRNVHNSTDTSGNAPTYGQRQLQSTHYAPPPQPQGSYAQLVYNKNRSDDDDPILGAALKIGDSATVWTATSSLGDQSSVFMAAQASAPVYTSTVEEDEDDSRFLHMTTNPNQQTAEQYTDQPVATLPQTSFNDMDEEYDDGNIPMNTSLESRGRQQQQPQQNHEGRRGQDLSSDLQIDDDQEDDESLQMLGVISVRSEMSVRSEQPPVRLSTLLENKDEDSLFEFCDTGRSTKPRTTLKSASMPKPIRKSSLPRPAKMHRQVAIIDQTGSHDSNDDDDINGPNKKVAILKHRRKLRTSPPPDDDETSAGDFGDTPQPFKAGARGNTTSLQERAAQAWASRRKQQQLFVEAQQVQPEQQDRLSQHSDDEDNGGGNDDGSNLNTKQSSMKQSGIVPDEQRKKSTGVSFGEHNTVHHFQSEKTMDESTYYSVDDRSLASEYTKSYESEVEDIFKDIFLIGNPSDVRPGRRKIHPVPPQKARQQPPPAAPKDKPSDEYYDEEGTLTGDDTTVTTSRYNDESTHIDSRGRESSVSRNSEASSVQTHLKKPAEEEDPLSMMWNAMETGVTAFTSALGLDGDDNVTPPKPHSTINITNTNGKPPTTRSAMPIPIKMVEESTTADDNCTVCTDNIPTPCSPLQSMYRPRRGTEPDPNQGLQNLVDYAQNIFYGASEEDSVTTGMDASIGRDSLLLARSIQSQFDSQSQSQPPSIMESASEFREVAQPLDERPFASGDLDGDERVAEFALHAAKAHHLVNGVRFDETSSIDLYNDIKFSVVDLKLPLGIVFLENDVGCWVTKVSDSGSAARSGEVEVGDQLAAIDGKIMYCKKVDDVCVRVTASRHPRGVELVFIRYVGPIRTSKQSIAQGGSFELQRTGSTVAPAQFQSDKTGLDDPPGDDTSNSSPTPTKSKRGFKWLKRRSKTKPTKK